MCESQEMLTKKELLQKAMENAMTEKPGRPLPKSLAQDFKMFEATKVRTEFLETLCQSMKTAKPTSVESERSFSVGGGFSTKLRSRLGDKTLSALVFLKMFLRKAIKSGTKFINKCLKF